MPEFSNSPLVSFTQLSPNCNKKRTHAIDTVTIHCTAGQRTVEQLGSTFAPASRKASCNYAIGSDGRVALIVPEESRSWCSSDAANDHRAVTIEVSSDDKTPYAVNDAAYASLIYLVADICRRNGIAKLLWRHDKSLVGKTDKDGKLVQNLTLHKWFANKACPGPFLEERTFDIVAKVNAIL